MEKRSSDSNRERKARPVEKLCWQGLILPIKPTKLDFQRYPRGIFKEGGDERGGAGFAGPPLPTI